MFAGLKHSDVFVLQDASTQTLSLFSVSNKPTTSKAEQQYIEMKVNEIRAQGEHLDAVSDVNMGSNRNINFIMINNYLLYFFNSL